MNWMTIFLAAIFQSFSFPLARLIMGSLGIEKEEKELAEKKEKQQNNTGNLLLLGFVLTGIAATAVASIPVGTYFLGRHHAAQDAEEILIQRADGTWVKMKVIEMEEVQSIQLK